MLTHITTLLVQVNRLTVINTQQTFSAGQKGDDHTGQHFAHL